MAWELIRTFIRIGVLNELAYRANFFVQAFESVITLGTSLGALAIVFNQTEQLAGWSPMEMVALVGVYYLVMGCINVVVAPSLSQFMNDIVSGDLDYTLTKPADAQLLVSVSQFRSWRVLDIFLGLAVLGTGVAGQANDIGLVETLLFTVALSLGAVIVYSFWLILATLAFWFLRVENILQIFWAMYTAARWPVTIYPQWLRLVLTLLVPVAFAITVPVQSLVGRTDWTMLVGAAVLATALAAFSRWFWKAGLKRYAGASA